MYFLLRCPLCILIAFGLMTMKHSSCAFRGGRFIFPSDFLWFFFTKRLKICLRPSCKKQNKTKQKNSNFVILCVLQVFCKPLRVWHFECMTWKQRESYQVTISGAKSRKFAAVQLNIWLKFVNKTRLYKKKKILESFQVHKNRFFPLINPTC